MSGKNKPFDRLILAFCSLWSRFADNIYRSLKSVLFERAKYCPLSAETALTSNVASLLESTYRKYSQISLVSLRPPP